MLEERYYCSEQTENLLIWLLSCSLVTLSHLTTSPWCIRNSMPHIHVVWDCREMKVGWEKNTLKPKATTTRGIENRRCVVYFHNDIVAWMLYDINDDNNDLATTFIKIGLFRREIDAQRIIYVHAHWNKNATAKSRDNTGDTLHEITNNGAGDSITSTFVACSLGRTFISMISLSLRLLVACTRLCTPIYRSVGWLFGRSVTHLFLRRFCGPFSHHWPCLITRDYFCKSVFGLVSFYIPFYIPFPSSPTIDTEVQPTYRLSIYEAESSKESKKEM